MYNSIHPVEDTTKIFFEKFGKQPVRGSNGTVRCIEEEKGGICGTHYSHEISTKHLPVMPET
jgi:hypothetical protein